MNWKLTNEMQLFHIDFTEDYYERTNNDKK